MTKRKVMEDLLGRSGADYLIEYNGYNIYLNSHCIIADKEKIPIPAVIGGYKGMKTMYDNVFPYNLAYELSDAIEVDYEALKKFIKGKRRNDIDKKPFIIDLGQDRYICANPWYLRNMIEYLSDRWTKNYNIFIKNEFFNRNEYKICKSPIYMFGGNQMDDQKILILPVNFIPAGYAPEPHMKWEVKWS